MLLFLALQVFQIPCTAWYETIHKLRSRSTSYKYAGSVPAPYQMANYLEVRLRK